MSRRYVIPARTRPDYNYVFGITRSNARYVVPAAVGVVLLWYLNVPYALQVTVAVVLPLFVWVSMRWPLDQHGDPLPVWWARYQRFRRQPEVYGLPRNNPR